MSNYKIHKKTSKNKLATKNKHEWFKKNGVFHFSRCIFDSMVDLLEIITTKVILNEQCNGIILFFFTREVFILSTLSHYIDKKLFLC